MTTERHAFALGRLVPELPVADVERAQRHYRDAMSFDIQWLDPTKEIGAVSRDNLAVFFRKTARPFQHAVNWVHTEDLDASYAELKSSGAIVLGAPKIEPWGLRQFAVQDLDGNLFYFHDGSRHAIDE